LKEIDDKVFKIVADQGANVKKAFKETISSDGYTNIISDMLNLDKDNDNTEILSENTEDESEVLYSNSDNTSSSHYLKEVSSEKEEIEESNECDVIDCFYLFFIGSIFYIIFNYL
jgi:hypothetical protein